MYIKIRKKPMPRFALSLLRDAQYETKGQEYRFVRFLMSRNINRIDKDWIEVYMGMSLHHARSVLKRFGMDLEQLYDSRWYHIIRYNMKRLQADNPVWPCGLLQEDWPTCGHGRACYHGQTCEAARQSKAHIPTFKGHLVYDNNTLYY